jgi:hypothetical protein
VDTSITSVCAVRLVKLSLTCQLLISFCLRSAFHTIFQSSTTLEKLKDSAVQGQLLAHAGSVESGQSEGLVGRSVAWKVRFGHKRTSNLSLTPPHKALSPPLSTANINAAVSGTTPARAPPKASSRICSTTQRQNASSRRQLRRRSYNTRRNLTSKRREEIIRKLESK